MYEYSKTVHDIEYSSKKMYTWIQCHVWWFITIFLLLFLRHVYRISRNMNSFWNYNWTIKAQRYTKTKLSEQNQRVIKRCKSKVNGITLLWEVQRECLQNRWSVRWWFVPKRMKRELVSFFSNHLIIDNQGLGNEIHQNWKLQK